MSKLQQISLDAAITLMMAEQHNVIMYMPEKEPEGLPIAVLKEQVDKGALFFMAVPEQPTEEVVEPEEEPPADMPEEVAEPEEKPKKPKAKPKKRPLDYGKMQALRDAGWTLKGIAGEMGCSEATVSTRTKARPE